MHRGNVGTDSDHSNGFHFTHAGTPFGITQKLFTKHPYSAGRVVLHSAQMQVYSEVRLCLIEENNRENNMFDKHYTCLNSKHNDNNDNK